MAYPAPTLAGFHVEKGEKEIVVSLSQLTDGLTVEIPNSAKIPADHTVYAILGEGEEIYESSSDERPAGRYIEDTETFDNLNDLKLHISKKTLEDYLEKPVDLRYHTVGESSMVSSSEPLTLRIEL